MKSLAELTELKEKSLATVNMRQKHEAPAGDGVRAVSYTHLVHHLRLADRFWMTLVESQKVFL